MRFLRNQPSLNRYRAVVGHGGNCGVFFISAQIIVMKCTKYPPATKLWRGSAGGILFFSIAMKLSHILTHVPNYPA